MVSGILCFCVNRFCKDSYYIETEVQIQCAGWYERFALLVRSIGENAVLRVYSCIQVGDVCTVYSVIYAVILI